MSSHFPVSYRVKGRFSRDISQEKTAGKCANDGTRHLAHLDQLSVPASHFASRPTLKIGSDCMFSSLQKPIYPCQVHNRHLLSCLSTAPAAQTAQTRGCKILALPGYDGSAKSWAVDEGPNYLVTSSLRFQHPSAESEPEKSYRWTALLYFTNIMYFSKQRRCKGIQHITKSSVTFREDVVFYHFHNTELLTTFNVLLVASCSPVSMTRQDKPTLSAARRESANNTF